MSKTIEITETTINKMLLVVRNWDGATERISERLSKTYNFTPDSFLLEDMATHTARRNIVSRLRAILDNDDNEAIIMDLEEYREELTDQLMNIRLHSSTSQASNLIDNKENEFVADVVRQLSRRF